MKALSIFDNIIEINVKKELPLELQTVTTDCGDCYYSHVHLQWFHARNNMPFGIHEIKPHVWYKLIKSKKDEGKWKI